MSKNENFFSDLATLQNVIKNSYFKALSHWINLDIPLPLLVSINVELDGILCGQTNTRDGPTQLVY